MPDVSAAFDRTGYTSTDETPALSKTTSLLPKGTIQVPDQVLRNGILSYWANRHGSGGSQCVFKQRPTTGDGCSFADGSERQARRRVRDLGPGPQTQLVEPVAPPNQWQFSFTLLYGWMTSVNGNATARGHTVDIDENFFEIVEKSELAHGSHGAISRAPERPVCLVYRRRLGGTFDGNRNFDVNRTVSGNPFARLPNFNVTIKGNLESIRQTRPS